MITFSKWCRGYVTILFGRWKIVYAHTIYVLKQVLYMQSTMKCMWIVWMTSEVGQKFSSLPIIAVFNECQTCVLSKRFARPKNVYPHMRICIETVSAHAIDHKLCGNWVTDVGSDSKVFVWTIWYESLICVNNCVASPVSGPKLCTDAIHVWVKHSWHLN